MKKYDIAAFCFLAVGLIALGGILGSLSGAFTEPTGRVTGKQTPHGPGRCTCTKGECACCPGCVGHRRAN